MDLGELASALVAQAVPVPVAFLFGLVIGSFANVVIHRLPERSALAEPPDGDVRHEPPLLRSIAAAWRRVRDPGRSRCPACGAPVRAYDNVPIASFLLLRGRCRDCHARISWRYPAVELGNGLLWAGLALGHGVGRALPLMLFATALLALSLIDLELQILPDALTLPGVAAGLGLAALASGGLLPDWPLPLVAAAAAAAGGYAMFWLMAAAWRRLRGVEALGQGDWKMAAMLGAFLGWQPLLLTVFLATLSGSVAGGALILSGRGDRQSKLPLGTFLGFAGIAVLFVGEPLLAWYRGLIDV